jgi:hypothetical protein
MYPKTHPLIKGIYGDDPLNSYVVAVRVGLLKVINEFCLGDPFYNHPEHDGRAYSGHFGYCVCNNDYTRI